MYRVVRTPVIAAVIAMSLPASASPVHAPLSIGFSAGADTVSLRAVSTGCTTREDFEFAVDEHGELNVVRTRPDTCRARPRTVEFEYRFEELGLPERVFVRLGAGG